MIAHITVIWTFLIVHPLHYFRNEAYSYRCAHTAQRQSDSQSGGCLAGLDREGDFFSLKTGMRYDQVMFTGRKSGNREGSVRIRLNRRQYCSGRV